MKKLLFLFTIITALSCHNLSAGPFGLIEFKGINSEESPLLISPDKSPDMNNITISEDGLSISRRKGQKWKFEITYPTWTVKSFGDVKNNTYDKLLVGYGPHIESFDVAWNASTMIHSTATVSYVWDFARFRDGNTYATNGKDTVFYTDGNTRTSITSAPKGTSIVFYNDTCFIANTAGNKARIQYSAWSDATDWTTGTGAAEGRVVDIADYGDKITDLEVLGNGVLVLCSNSIMKMIGTQNPYQVITVDKSIGCRSKGSVSTHLGWTYFLGSDGQKYRTDGNIVENLSEKEFRDNIGNTALSQRTANFSSLTSEADWATGITSHTSTSEISGSVVCTQGTTTYTSATDWNAWTLTNIDTTTVLGSMIISEGTTEAKLESQETATWSDRWIYGGLKYAQTFKVSSGKSISKIKIRLSKGSGATFNGTIKLYSDGGGEPGSELGSISFNQGDIGTSNTWISFSFASNINISINTTYWIEIYADGSGSSNNLVINYALDAYADGSMWFYDLTSWSEVSPSYDITFEIYGFYNYAASGQAISPIIDTEKESAFNLVWGLVTWSSSTVANTTNKIYVRTSNNSDMSSSSYVEQTDEEQITESVKRYIQIKNTITTTDSTITPQLNDVTLNWATKGYYITPEITTVDLNTWGLFEAVDAQSDAGASITYFTYSSDTVVTDSYLKDTASWTSQTNNAIIVVAINTYVWAKAVFDIAVASEVPRVDAITLNWTSGDDTTEDMTAQWHEERLYLGVMQNSSSSSNDAVFVYDPDLKSWFPYKTGVFPSSFFKWKNTFLVASSTSGVVYEFLSGNDDNGTNIDCYYKSKYLTGTEGISPFISSLEHFTVIYSTQNSGNMKIDVYLNGSSTAADTYTIDQTANSSQDIDFNSYKFPRRNNCRYFQFKIYNDSGSNIELLGLIGEATNFPLRIQTQ